MARGGALDLRTLPQDSPTISLQAPSGVVELIADPWPEGQPCPVFDGTSFGMDVPAPSSSLGKLARGELAPGALRRQPGKTLPSGQTDACLTGPSLSLYAVHEEELGPDWLVRRPTSPAGMPPWPVDPAPR